MTSLNEAFTVVKSTVSQATNAVNSRVHVFLSTLYHGFYIKVDMLVPANLKHLAIVQLISVLLVPAEFVIHQPLVTKVAGGDADAA